MATATANTYVDGTLERVLFHNAESRWTVAKLAVEDGTVSIVGLLYDVPVGTPLRLHGNWVVDKRYGRQFKVESYQTKSPETLLGIERYLGSGLVPGIGPELAKRIVAHFGLETLDIITRDPGRLSAVDGIGESRIDKISAAWADQRDVQDVMIFLRGHGVSGAFAARIFKHYGREAIAKIRENPYRLALDIWGIGFRTADGIARELGIAEHAPERLEAGLVHALGQACENGHVHVPEPHLTSLTAELLSVSEAPVTEALERLTGGHLVVREVLADRGACIALASMWREEHEAAQAFVELVSTPSKALKLSIDSAIAQFAESIQVELAPAQKQAIAAAAIDKCVVITGGPGVGKTTIVRGVVHLFARAGRKFVLAAPTGRAAKRLSETTQTTATTIHRLLEFQPQNSVFLRGPDVPLDADVVIIDEASMIDIGLFHSLLAAIPKNAQLVLVGDVDQLPSVGPGSVLADIIASNAATVVRLTEIFRQAKESRIITNAHAINAGKLPQLAAGANEQAANSDFFFVERTNAETARDTLVEMVANRIPKRFGLDPLTQVQVLCPMHRGVLGTIAVNAALQAKLNPAYEGVSELTRGSRTFRVGDKVMQTRNDYDKNVFNGDIGVVRAVRTGDTPVVVEFFDGRIAEYERRELDQLTHAYAISVHKSQGSEYPAVVLPLVTQHYMMLQRNLLYTAVTRGRQLVVLVGHQRAVAMAVQNGETKDRWTWLSQRIADNLQSVE